MIEQASTESVPYEVLLAHTEKALHTVVSENVILRARLEMRARRIEQLLGSAQGATLPAQADPSSASA